MSQAVNMAVIIRLKSLKKAVIYGITGVSNILFFPNYLPKPDIARFFKSTGYRIAKQIS